MDHKTGYEIFWYSDVLIALPTAGRHFVIS
jgi:hypothetical protein